MSAAIVGTWAGTTTVHPIGVAALATCIIAVFLLKNHRIIIPLLALFIVIPSAQRVVIASIDFSFIRILILIILARIYFKKHNRGLSFTRADTYILLWMIWGIFSYGVLQGGFSGFVTRTGFMIEAVGAYYIGRVYIRTPEALKDIVIFIAKLSVPIMILFLVERSTGRNMFSVFGGVYEFTLIRDGRLRCQGPFSHPIMAGVFWASMLPWLVPLWYENIIARWKILLFAFSITVIVLNTASSTPVMAIIFGVIGFSLFKKRNLMPAIRWGILISLPILHLIMDKPVWHILARANIVGSSTGWHRYFLIDMFVEHVNEWWLFGTTATAHWGKGLGDITNQYVLEGVRGGMLGMVFFIMILVSVFSMLGKKIKIEKDKKLVFVYWSAGVVLFIHSMNFLAVSYFGQVVSAFFLFAGITVSLVSNKQKVIPVSN